MPKEYTDAQQVLNDMQPILNSCAKLNNKVDGIAFLNGVTMIERSEVPGFGGEFDIRGVASLLGNFTETNENTFGESTVLKHISFLNQDLQTQGLIAWSLVFPYKSYSLVFTGQFAKEKWYAVHQGTVAGYVQDILPLIKEYDRLT
ncbi:hypothetical protein [Limnospira platensis]|uniref:hypothetical protein n=1 Tax=Limnospira platensis TaxID=118562 RepID=UPI003D6EF4C4